MIRSTVLIRQEQISSWHGGAPFDVEYVWLSRSSKLPSSVACGKINPLLLAVCLVGVFLHALMSRGTQRALVVST